MSVKISRNSFRINPMLQKELKVKMRSWKTPILIGIYNLVLTLLTMFIINIQMESSEVINQRNIFITYAFLVGAQFGLIALIAPAMTAGAISGERERQTLDILLSTTLKHRSIITGKLLSSLSQIIILIISSIPAFSIIFLYGGIGIMQLVQVFLFYIVVAITFGSIGIFFSTFIKKSTAANVLSYAVVVFLGIGTILIAVAFMFLIIKPTLTNGMSEYTSVVWILYLNPGIGLVSLVLDQLGQGAGSLFPGLYLTAKEGIQFWQINCIINVVLSALLLFFSALKLNPTRKKLKKKA